ncbi:DEAD/DEAH box helicase [Gilvimarinus xylanilyticus]|uniref:ATP-dependent RNA helicase DeaD n=1 Tax=Gilvimarinus xylanilyticus TaxID=2944139 RepID=A0A9X2I175_9GAMM|nr:DEAD/DEAH box helicase [Gilvimarinus xylanilyticus]MCP8898311.1 DEAD/DEAH box helicase [Gilvimarinus xylanilyticus]
MSSENIAFSELNLSQPVLNAISKIGYETPSPIQARAIPALLDGKDIVGLAQTGTGKTAAFALPLLSSIDTQSSDTQVLVLAPTRELAIQVAEAFQSYASELNNFHVLPIYGGQDMRGQLRQLKRGAQVVVGTPGRVMDHLRRNSLDLSNLKAMVLDEADEMLRMGFIDDVTWIMEHTPESRQTALFSATMPKEIRRVANTYLRSPEEIKVARESTTGSNIEQAYWMVSGTNKLDALTRILEVEPFDGIIMFVRTKTATVELAEKLEARGYSAAAINGDMNQALRERTIERLKNKSLDILIATDVAARGIDVERVSHVINYDIPYDSEAYVHRIGRTGRAGRSGKAILFVAPREKRLLYSIEKATGQRIEAMKLPSGDTVSAARIDQFLQQITDVVNSEEDMSFFEELLAKYSRENDLEPEAIATALAYLLQKNRPLQVKFADIKPERERSRDRGERGERPRRSNRGPEEGMKRYRIEVGRNHGARPGDIVGAIANEAGLKGRSIGQIKLFDSFATLDLPEDLAPAQAKKIASLHVRGQQLSLSEDRGPMRKGGDKGKAKPRKRKA